MKNFSGVTKDECVEKKIPKGVKLESSRTIILQSVINKIKEHGRSSMNKEVCGVFVGDLCWDQNPYLLIDACIEGKFADHQSGSVTFTSETWDYIHDELAEKHSEKKIVGWYHTHPGFGIFLSNMDFFIHENFFGLKWQPAYVFDPQAETDGFFFWEGDKLEQKKVAIIKDEPPISKKTSVKKSNKISVVVSEKEEETNNKQRLLYAFYTVFLIILALIGSFAIYFLYQDNMKLQKTIEDENIKRVQWQAQIKQEQEAEALEHQTRIEELETQLKKQEEQIVVLESSSQSNQVAIIELQTTQKEKQKAPEENPPKQTQAVKWWNPFSWF